MLLFAASLVLPVTDTVWWQTPGGSVTEVHDAKRAECSLTFYDSQQQFVFTWQRGQPFHGFAVRDDWHFDRNTKMTVNLKIGSHLIANQAAEGADRTIVFLVGQPIDDLLTDASQITVQTSAAETMIKLPPSSKVAALMVGLHRCRAALNLPA